MRPSTRHAALAAVLCTTLPALSARAEGPGLRVGDLAIHPEFFALGGFDDNVYFAAPEESPLASSLLRLGGGVSVENRSPNKVSLEGGVNLSYRHYFPSDTPPSEKALEARNTIDRAGLNATVGFLPHSPVTTELHEDFKLRDNPAYDDLELGFQKYENSAGVDVRFRPGSNPESRPLELRLGYRYQVVRFFGGDLGQVGADQAEKDVHALDFLTLWRFLPKTALFLDVAWSSVDYLKAVDVNALLADGTIGQAVADRDSRPFTVAAGVKGLVTRRISTNLKVGYRNTFNAKGTSFSGLIATAEGTYAIEPSLRATLGYNRDGRDTAFANAYTLNQVYAVTDVYFLGKFSAGGRIGFDHYAYSDDAGGAQRLDGERTDPVLRGSIYAGYTPRDWLTVKLQFESTNNMSDYEIGRYAAENAPPGSAGGQVDPVAYSRQFFGLEVQAQY